MKTSVCVICGKQKKPSLEHIIPEALGNEKLITEKICEECNNKLGEKIDCFLTDNFLYKLLRKEHGFRGKKNNEVRLFPTVLKDAKDDLYDVNEQEYTITLRPMTKSVENGYVSKAETLKQAKDSARKKLERLGKTPAQIKDILSKSKIVKSKLELPEFTIQFKIDIMRCRLAIIKIAYEYACEKLGNPYMMDELAQILRNELYEVIYHEKNIDQVLLGKYIRHAPSFINDEIKGYKENLKDLPNKLIHIIMLCKDQDNQLLCQIYFFLEPNMSYVVKLSNDANRYLKENSTYIDLIFNDGKNWSF